MLESLPEPDQQQAVEQLREYIAEREDELEWEQQFKKTEGKLARLASTVREKIEDDEAEPMDYDRL
jgi:hypothetical protein